MTRLFVALKIPEIVRVELLNHCFHAAENPLRYKWEDKDKIHLTLKFIGDVEEDLVGPITNELEFVKNYSSFNCTISHFGFFFKDNEPRILWSDLETDETVHSLVDELNARLEKFNIVSEKRKFKGHLTLLRIRVDVTEKFIKRFKGYSFDKIIFKANEIALVQSRLAQGGSMYTDLKTYELK